jgi:hypothetical protein
MKAAFIAEPIGTYTVDEGFTTFDLSQIIFTPVDVTGDSLDQLAERIADRIERAIAKRANEPAPVETPQYFSLAQVAKRLSLSTKKVCAELDEMKDSDMLVVATKKKGVRRHRTRRIPESTIQRLIARLHKP